MNAKASKSITDDEFAAQLRAERNKGHVGMVMTKPPVGKGKSLEEMLNEHRGEIDSPSIERRGLVAGKNLQMIPINLIDENPFAPREVYTSEMIERRASALREQGQNDPIHVIPHPDLPGRYIISDGWTRVQACKAHKVLDELLAEIHDDLSVEEAAWLGFHQNEQREMHCDLDRAQFFEKMHANGMTATDIARRSNVSETAVSFLRSFSKLDDSVISVVKKNPKRLGMNEAYYLAQLQEHSGPEAAANLAMEYIDPEAEEKRPRAWLINHVKSIVRPKKTTSTSSITKQVKYANGYLKQRGNHFEVSFHVEGFRRKDFAEQLDVLLKSFAEEPQDETGDGDE
ncbi:ParB/RepB/Spo0J family partition protein [Thauera aminoaromatica]|uniref:ParB/RepB/Spo0J family partition protein n=1 Tax=Thauera aminoaromatica TaxID=164330 RepID=A0A5C7SNQ9_THASP|nr:ParB/RepB/Spo0J family partition protein [Thauera aminoaromatica]TXH84706.1 MAG: ParB/RepB/Spo0J family partition protein [Thauera aminoaromatica]